VELIRMQHVPHFYRLLSDKELVPEFGVLDL
jgi:hypothetical protein